MVQGKWYWHLPPNSSKPTRWVMEEYVLPRTVHNDQGINARRRYQTVSSVQLLSHVRLCNPMDCSMPGFPVHHQLPELTQTHVLYDWWVWSPCCPRDSQESSPTPEFKSISLWHSAFLMVQLSQPYMATWKPIALTRWTFVSKVMSAF